MIDGTPACREDTMPPPTPDKILCCHRRCSLAAIADQRVGERAAGSHRLALQRRSGYSLLRATIAGLRTHAPAAFPVIVRSGANVPPDTDAYCTRRHSRFVIMLGHHLGSQSAVEAVIHEWAHARAWSHMHDRAAADMQAGRIDAAEFEVLVHDGTWGVEFAFCWRVFTGKVLPGFDPAAA
jgi:hypothetical protein